MSNVVTAEIAVALLQGSIESLSKSREYQDGFAVAGHLVLDVLGIPSAEEIEELENV